MNDKSTIARPLLTEDSGQLKIDVRWLETKPQIINCRHIGHECQGRTDDSIVDLLMAHPVSRSEYRRIAS